MAFYTYATFNIVYITIDIIQNINAFFTINKTITTYEELKMIKFTNSKRNRINSINTSFYEPEKIESKVRSYNPPWVVQLSYFQENGQRY